MSPRPSRGALFFRRGALLLGGLLASLAVLEGGLRLAGSAYLRRNPRPARGSGALRILCLGDSNTFGIWMDEAGTYPAQLSSLLEDRAPGAFEVVNLGVPGINTWTILAHLEDDLARFAPAAAVLLAGINDRWGAPPEDGARDSPFERLRILRLARLLGARATLREEAPAPEGGERIAATMRDGETRPFVVGGKPLAEDEPALERQVRTDLVAAVERVRARGAVPILSTYAADRDPYVPVNAGIRAASAATGARLVDASAAFRSGGPGVDRGRLLLPDDHPDREGYGAIARLVLNGLVSEGVAPGPPIADPFEAIRGRPRPSPRLRIVPGESADPILEVEFLPGFDCKVFLSAGASEGTRVWGFPIPLDREEVFEKTARLDALLVAFDSEGRARIPITAGVREAIGRREVKAVALAVRWAFVPGHPREELARFPLPDFGPGYVAGCSEAVSLHLP